MSEIVSDVETWRTVPGYADTYEVSNCGRVRSLDRDVVQRTGKVQHLRGRVLTIQTSGDGRRFVVLSRNGQSQKCWIDDLVSKAATAGSVVSHLRSVQTDSEIDDPPAPVIRGEIVHVPFHGDDLMCVRRDDKPHVVLKPVIEGLGLDYWTQVEKLRGKSWAVTRQSLATGADGKTYQMVTVDVRTLLMLLATIDENRVAPAVVPKLIAYQAEVADAIESYFTQGAAINPRATEVVQAPANPIDLLRGMLDQIAAAQEAGQLALTTAHDASQDARLANARLDAIEDQRDGWVAGLGYAKLHGLQSDVEYVKMVGTLAGTIGRARGLTPIKVPSQLFGKVNGWPPDVWAEAFARFGGTS